MDAFRDAHIAQMEYNEAVENNKFNLVVKLGLAPMRDGDQWCFLWGENIMVGVAGFGSTVAQAAENFESACYNKINRKKENEQCS